MTTMDELVASAEDLLETANGLERNIEKLQQDLDEAHRLVDQVRFDMDLMGLSTPAAAPEAKAPPKKMRRPRGAARALIESCFEGGVTMSPADLMRETGLDNKLVTSHLTRLKRAGVLMRVGHGLYRKAEYC